MTTLRFGLPVPGRMHNPVVMDVVSGDYGGAFTTYVPSTDPTAVTSPHLAKDTSDNSVALYVHDGTTWNKFLLQAAWQDVVGADGDALVAALEAEDYDAAAIIALLDAIDAFDAGAPALVNAITADAAEINKLDGLATTQDQLGSVAVSPGSKARGMIYIGAEVTDGDTVTLGDNTYEFDTAADPGEVTEGNIRVDVSSAVTPANATDQLIAAINANETAFVAIDISTNLILLLGATVGVSAIDLTETFDSADNIVSVVTDKTYGGAAPAIRSLYTFAHVPTAGEVTIGSIYLPCDPVPTSVIVQVRSTADGSAVAWDGKITVDGTNKCIVLDNSGDVDWSDTDTIHIIAVA